MVVNTYLYGLHVASDGTILPDHDVVVFDEAHGLEDIMSTTLSVQISPGRFVALAAVIRRILDDPEVVAGVVDVADVIREALAAHVGERLPIHYPDELQSALLEARARSGAGPRRAHQHRHADRGRQDRRSCAPNC